MDATSDNTIGYSYIRFSTADQAKGDSLRRQTELAADWCKRNGVRLDTSLTLRDLGKSAYTGKHRQNPDRHALAAFLKMVEQGKIPRGSCLIVESLDRLTREHIRPALTLMLNLIEAGVRVVQLKPVELVYDEAVEPMTLMMALMELSRGNSESKMKSERIGKAWQEKKRLARDQKQTLSRSHLPAWIEERDGQRRSIPERAAAVKRIFAMSTAGYGLSSIVRRLVEDKVPAFGKSKQWSRAYIAKILTDRRALGEYQPRFRKGRAADGDVIKDFFPAVVGEDEWLAVRAGAAQRRDKPGRIGQHVHLFSGMLKEARSGEAMYSSVQTGRRRPGESGRSHNRILRNMESMEGRAKCVTFPLEVFENAVLSQLREIDPHEILNGDSGPDESQVLGGDLARIEARIAGLERELFEGGDDPSIARVLRQLNDQKRDLATRLADARQKAAHPLSESWGECGTLIEALDNAPDPNDARLRLRGALRRIIDMIFLVIVPRRQTRLCGIQIWFAGGERHRDYLVIHRPAMGRYPAQCPAQWWTWSLADVTQIDDLDLRRREDALALEKELLQLDLAAIIEAN